VSDAIDILIIDDNDLQLKYMAELLSSHGYSTETSMDSRKAIETILRVNPKLVILDIMMPHLDGFTVLKRMREEKKLSKIPVIIYSGKSYPTDEKKARSLGANSYIIKPVKGSVIVEEVKKYL
jgi:DNA-binding response OmpR family regulator